MGKPIGALAAAEIFPPVSRRQAGIRGTPGRPGGRIHDPRMGCPAA